jgi:hypothetical protein
LLVKNFWVLCPPVHRAGGHYLGSDKLSSTKFEKSRVQLGGVRRKLGGVRKFNVVRTEVQLIVVRKLVCKFGLSDHAEL